MTEPGELSLEDLQKLDELIVQERILEGLQMIRSKLGLDLRQSLESFNERYRFLRAERPDAFTKPDREYGKDFYS
jgi:hypothetical protein